MLRRLPAWPDGRTRGCAACLRHGRKRCEEILVDRIGLAVDAGLFSHVTFETAPLFGNVGQFAEGVGKFHTAGVKLETFRNARIPRRRACKCGFRYRVFTEDRCPVTPKVRLHLVDQNLAEEIGPAVIRRMAHAGAGQFGGKAIPVGVAVFRHRGQQVDTGVALEGLRQRQPFRFGEGIDNHVAEGKLLRARRLGGERQKGGAIIHQPVIGFCRPVPFQHGEFRMMQRSALAVAIDMGEGEDPLFAGGKQFLGGKFRRRVQVKRGLGTIHADRFRRKGMQVRLVTGRNLQRCRIHLDEIARLEPLAKCGLHPVATDQERPAVLMARSAPPWGAGGGRALRGHLRLSSRVLSRQGFHSARF